MKRVLAHVLATGFLVASMGAAPVKKSNLGPSQAANAIPKPYQVGRASWYGKPFAGRSTASGETFDMYLLTAAHRTLPMGTQVKVTNLANGRSLIVRINDRGPMITGRIIDLSYAAARVLLLSQPGIGKVRLDLVPAAREVALLSDSSATGE